MICNVQKMSLGRVGFRGEPVGRGSLACDDAELSDGTQPCDTTECPGATPRSAQEYATFIVTPRQNRAENG